MGAFVSIQRRLGCICFVSRALSLCDEGFQIIHEEGRMRLVRGTKIRFDADVKLRVIRLKPGSTAFGKISRFWDFGEA